MKPIAPTNTTVNLPASEATKAAWKNPNNMTTEQLAAASKK